MTKITAEYKRKIREMKAIRKSNRIIARELKVYPSTIKRVTKDIELMETKVRKTGSGRKPKIPYNLRNRYTKFALKNNRLGANKLASRMIDKFNISVSGRTLKRVNRSLMLRTGKPKMVPSRTSLHQKKRLNWCKKYKKVDWTTVIFSDEKTFYGGCSKGQVRYKIGCRPIAPINQHEIKINVWWGVSLSYKIEPYIYFENLDQVIYRNILNQRLPDKNINPYVLMQDNAPSHKAKKTLEWLETNTSDYIKDWPALSPDLNPIENLWSIVDKKVHEKDLPTIASLKRRVKQVIDDLPDNIVNNVINSLPGRINRCIKAKGGDFVV
jgi:hypothetical protein